MGGMSVSDASAVVDVLKTYFAALHESSEAKFHLMWHPRGALLGIGPSGTVVARGSEEFLAGVTKRAPSIDLAAHDRILSLEMIDDTCASAKVQVALPPTPNSPTPTFSETLDTAWLTLLHDPSIDGGSWRIISKVKSSVPLFGEAAAIGLLPQDFIEASAAVWDGYCSAGRRCDEAAMRRIFHPLCNLTFATPDSIVLVDCDAFCERVGNRWELPVHRPYAHLKDDPRASAADTLLSIDFAGPGVCRAILRIGYPPFLYTDVLLLLEATGGSGSWWIVAKSSGNVPFLKEAARSESCA